MSAALFHDAVNGGQSQSGTLSHLLGSKKWLEEMKFGVFVHALSGITDRDLGIDTRRDAGMTARVGIIEIRPARGDRQSAPPRHRVPRIQREIQQHLLHLAAIRFHMRQIGRKLRNKLNVLADQAPQHPFHLPANSVWIQYDWHEDLLPSER